MGRGVLEAFPLPAIWPVFFAVDSEQVENSVPEFGGFYRSITQAAIFMHLRTEELF